MAEWTVERVAAQFEEASRTAHRLPPVRKMGYAAYWPPIKRGKWERLYADQMPRAPSPPSPEAVSRLEQATGWIRWLPEEDRHLIWARARKEPWKEICGRLGCDRTTAWRRWKAVLQLIVLRLQGPVVISPRAPVQRGVGPRMSE